MWFLRPSLLVSVGHSIRRMPSEHHNTCSLRSRNARRVLLRQVDRRTNRAYGSQSLVRFFHLFGIEGQADHFNLSLLESFSVHATFWLLAQSFRCEPLAEQILLLVV